MPESMSGKAVEGVMIVYHVSIGFLSSTSPLNFVSFCYVSSNPIAVTIFTTLRVKDPKTSGKKLIRI